MRPGALWAVLLFALAVRLVWGALQPGDARSLGKLPDQGEYLQLAQNLLHHHVLSMTDPHWGDEVYAYRTPGYPLFVAACGASVRVVRVAQALLDTSTVLAAYLIARRWLTRRASLFAAGVVAINPFLIYFSGLILSETLFTAMLAWGMALLVGWKRAGGSGDEADSDPRWTLLGGVVLALSVLVRPSALGLPVALAIAAALLNPGRRGAYPRWWPFGPAGGATVLIVLTLLPWAYRNDRVLHRWIWTTTNAGITAYDGFNDDATGASDQRFAGRYRMSFPELREAGEVERDQYLADRAMRWISAHPARALGLARAKIVRTWSPMPLSSEYGRPIYRAIGLLFAVPLDFLVLCGLMRSGRGPGSRLIPRMGKVLMLLPAIYLTLIHATSVGSLRYRLPAEPLLAVVAAGGWMRIVERTRPAGSAEMRYKRAPSSFDA